MILFGQSFALCKNHNYQRRFKKTKIRQQKTVGGLDIAKDQRFLPQQKQPKILRRPDGQLNKIYISLQFPVAEERKFFLSRISSPLLYLLMGCGLIFSLIPAGITVKTDTLLHVAFSPCIQNSSKNVCVRRLTEALFYPNIAFTDFMIIITMQSTIHSKYIACSFAFLKTPLQSLLTCVRVQLCMYVPYRSIYLKALHITGKFQIHF